LAGLFLQALRQGLDLIGHGVHARIGGVAQVDAELDPPRDDIAAVGVHLHHAHRAAPVRRKLLRRQHHRLHQSGGHLQGVAAQGHGGGPGVGLHAHHRAVKPANAQHTGDHANRHARIFEHRPLFDVGFKIRANRVLAGDLGADIANALELFAHRLAVLVAGLVGMLEREGASKHPRAHHHRHKTRAFFVGPKSHFNGRFGFDAMVVEASHHFQTSQHAVIAIELAAGGLGVDVAAGHDGRQIGVAPRAAHEHIANLVHRHRHARFAAPLGDQVAPLAVQVAQGQAAHPAFGGGANLGQRHQGVPQSLVIDAQIGQGMWGQFHGAVLCKCR